MEKWICILVLTLALLLTTIRATQQKQDIENLEQRIEKLEASK